MNKKHIAISETLHKDVSDLADDASIGISDCAEKVLECSIEVIDIFMKAGMTLEDAIKRIRGTISR